MADDLYDINKYTDKQLYDILDMNNPTDRELEAKIIHLINKYENMQNESGDQLALFFHRIYNRFFNTDDIEGFQNPTPDPSKSMDESKFALSNDDSTGNANTNANILKLKSPNATLKQISSTPVTDGEISTKTVGYEPQNISSVQQFDYSADKLQLNPLLKQTIKRIISIDSQYRDIKTNPLTTSFSFDLSEPLRDVVSLKLYSVQIPYTWYTIPKSYGSNFFYLKGATSGINDGNHDYKIEINPGNYTPSELEFAINQRFYDISNITPNKITSYMKTNNLSEISSASDVNFYNQNLINYKPNTSKMTMNIDLQKVYTEAYYQLYFPNWSSPVTDSSSSIPGYIGFNNETYDLCSITSNQTEYTTSSITGQVTQDYILVDGSNNYFTVNVYSNTSLIKTYTITLLQNNGSKYTGLASRTQIYDSINYTLQNYKDEQTGENVFDTNSGIKYIDIPINKQNAGKRYYRLTIILNRYIVKYTINTKVEVVFPTEIPNNENNSTTIWTYNISSQHNAFFFDTTTNLLNEFVSESPAVASSYIVDTSTNILLTCKKTNYTGGTNDISLNIPSNLYTLTGLTNAITKSFKDKSNTSPGNITFYTESTSSEIKGAYIDPSTQKFTLTVDLEKKFSTEFYDISWDSTSLLGSMGSYNIGNIWTKSEHLVAERTFGHRIRNITSGYGVNKTYIFTITPNITIIPNPGNRDASAVDVNLPSLPPNGFFATIGDYTKAINDAIINTTVDNQFVLAGSSFTSTLDSTSLYYDLSLNISYNYSLTERNYDISFTDHTYKITDISNIWRKFDISSNYDLSLNNNYTTTTGAYAVITGGSQIAGDEIQVIDGSNTIILQTNGLSKYSIPNNTIKLQITPGKYTINTLYTEINTQINKYPMLYGSQIVPIENSSKVYTKFILTINNIYTSKDYNIVFYDPFSFAKCYSGSRSVQNTTWDSTLGWILGYRDYTQYSLVSSNVAFDSYYLISQNGSYIYTPTTNTISQLLTNVKIILEGDTTVSTNLYNYFLISLDDYIQNHLNDGLVTITRKETALSLPDYSYATTQICDPITNKLTSISTQQSNSDNVTNKQLYSLNQSIYSQQNAIKTYSPGPFIKDLFGFIPIKPPSKNGDYYIEFGGSLQNQERLYFGPVNIRKMTIQLLNDRGDVVDLNNTNWSFSFICEQLYRASSS
jgi:hypothetical protein